MPYRERADYRPTYTENPPDIFTSIPGGSHATASRTILQPDDTTIVSEYSDYMIQQLKGLVGGSLSAGSQPRDFQQQTWFHALDGGPSPIEPPAAIESASTSITNYLSFTYVKETILSEAFRSRINTHRTHVATLVPEPSTGSDYEVGPTAHSHGQQDRTLTYEWTVRQEAEVENTVATCRELTEKMIPAVKSQLSDLTRETLENRWFDHATAQAMTDTMIPQDHPATATWIASAFGHTTHHMGD
ncbi:hypothetical protein IAU59_002002 [Kwoniella sp. CBS 9459]